MYFYKRMEYNSFSDRACNFFESAKFIFGAIVSRCTLNDVSDIYFINCHCILNYMLIRGRRSVYHFYISQPANEIDSQYRIY